MQRLPQSDGETPLCESPSDVCERGAVEVRSGAAAIEYYDPDPELFEKYCDAFCQQFDVDYICTDIYPLNWKNGAKFTYPEYAESIDVIASVARKRQRDFWRFIQTFAWIPSKRTPAEEE